jgi:hypothetical protein
MKTRFQHKPSKFFAYSFAMTFLVALITLAACGSRNKALAATSEKENVSMDIKEPDLSHAEKPFLIGNAKPKAEFWPNSNLRIESAFVDGKWELSAVGTLPNSCYKFSHLEIRKLKQFEFQIIPYAVITHGAMCLMVITPLVVKLDLKEAIVPEKTHRFFIKTGPASHSAIEVKIPK